MDRAVQIKILIAILITLSTIAGIMVRRDHEHIAKKADEQAFRERVAQRMQEKIPAHLNTDLDQQAK
jgi:hypothetical protein